MVPLLTPCPVTTAKRAALEARVRKVMPDPLVLTTAQIERIRTLLFVLTP